MAGQHQAGAGQLATVDLGPPATAMQAKFVVRIPAKASENLPVLLPIAGNVDLVGILGARSALFAECRPLIR